MDETKAQEQWSTFKPLQPLSLERDRVQGLFVAEEREPESPERKLYTPDRIEWIVCGEDGNHVYAVEAHRMYVMDGHLHFVDVADNFLTETIVAIIAPEAWCTVSRVETDK